MDGIKYYSDSTYFKKNPWIIVPIFIVVYYFISYFGALTPFDIWNHPMAGLEVVLIGSIIGLILALIQRGEIIEISEKGINLGSKYLGPLDTMSDFGLYRIGYAFKMKPKLFFQWDSIKNISFIEWDQKSLIGGRLETSSNFVEIKDDKGKYYIIQLSFSMPGIDSISPMESIKEVIKNLGKDNLIEEKVELRESKVI